MSTNAEVGIYGESDTEGCVFVVGSYSDIASSIRSVVAKAAIRILMSPVLGDFTEIRFVDLGSRPRRSSVGASAIPRIVRELLCPAADFERNYFALAVIDKSATRAEKVLHDLTVAPPAAALPMRYRGLAAVDDRKPLRVREDADPPTVDDMVWLLGSFTPENLANALMCFAHESMLEFSGGRERGLTHAEIRPLRPAEDEDELTETPKPGEGREQNRQMPDIPISRLGSFLRKVRDRSSAPSTISPPDTAKTDARPDGLVLLILNADEWSDERGACRRGQSMLLKLDEKLGKLPRLSYQVHAIQASANAVESHPKRAGQLSRTDIRVSSLDLDLEESLKTVRSALREDLASVAPLRKRPFIVFFAVDPPFADPVSVKVYGELALEACIIWVMHEQSADLLSPAFVCQGARIMTNNEAVVNNILHLLQEEEREADAGAASSTSLPDARA